MEQETRSPIKAAGVALVVAIALLAPLGGFLFWRYSQERPGMRGESANQADTASEVSGSAAKRAPRQFATEDPDDPKKRPLVKRAAVKVKPPPKSAARPAPVPASIPAGMEKSKLLAMFGKPQMITVEIQNGLPIETFHYLQRDTGMETIVRLSAGRVVSAGATVY
jgi:hypothetical protein